MVAECRMLKMKVWSPGFSRRDVGNFDDCEMFELAENMTRAPAKAGTPYSISWIFAGAWILDVGGSMFGCWMLDVGR